MKKLALLLMATVVFTMMSISFVYAEDDTNPYSIVKSPPIIVEHK